jgi:hypothetical protein
MIAIDLDDKGEKIILRSSRATPGLAKHVPGSRFSKEGGPHWNIPLSMDSCRSLRRRFGDELRVGSRLSSWAREAMAGEERMRDLSRATDAELLRVPEVSPVLAAAMANRTNQRVGARNIAEGRRVLNADQPGLGKTLEAIGGIIESGIPGPYLAIAPKTAVTSVWELEVPRWWPGQNIITVPDGRTKREQILDGLLNLWWMNEEDHARGVEPLMHLRNTWVLLHPEAFRTRSWWACPCGIKTKWKAGPKKLECKEVCQEPHWDGKECQKPHTQNKVCQESVSDAKTVNEHEYPQLFQIEWPVIITDESDVMLVRKTATPNLIRRGAELLRSRPNGLRIPMSGTPWRAKPELIWGTLNWLDAKRFSSYWRFVETFYEVELGWGGSRKIGEFREDMEEEFDRMVSGMMLRRTKAEVAADLPPKSYVGSELIPGVKETHGVWLEMTPDQQKLYDQMAAESAVALEGGTLSAVGILAEMTRLKQFAASAGRFNDRKEFVPCLPSSKLEYFLDLAHQLGMPGKPETRLVVVSQFTQILNMFRAEMERMKLRPCMLTGEVTGSKRAGIISAFNTDPDGPDIMLLQVKTGGVAITIDSADHMGLVDEVHGRPDVMEQVEDRIHRVSKPRPVFYHYARCRNSVDEAIALRNAELAQESEARMDGRRGVAIPRAYRELYGRLLGAR